MATNHKHALPTLAIISMCMISLVACHTEPMDANFYTEGHPNQRFDLDLVKKRLKNIQPGATRIDVLLELGSPAEQSSNKWTYLPSRPGFIIPTQSLEVYFIKGVYVSHKYKSIILGEKVTSP